MRSSLVLLVSVAIGAGGARVEACAACSCGDPTLTATGVEKPYANRVRVGFEERFGSFATGNATDGDHGLYLHSVLSGSWSPHDRVTVALRLPWITKWLTPAGGSLETINGLGDLELSARIVVFRERPFAPHHLLWGIAGLKAPTGYRVFDPSGNPYPDDDQPGSGSWDPFVGVTYGWFGERLAFFASASYRATTANTRGYQRGSSLNVSAALQVRVWSWAAFAGALEASSLRADTLPSGADAPDSGGTVIHLAPSLLITPVTDLLIKLTASVPVIHALNGTQDMGTQFVLALAWDAH